MSLVVTSVKNTKRQMEKQRVTMKFCVAAWEYKGNQVMLFTQRGIGFDNVKLVTVVINSN
jgi:hypothetical protein